MSHRTERAMVRVKGQDVHPLQRIVARHSYSAPRGGSLPCGWRERLPDPADYYGQHVEQLNRANSKGWAQGKCPLHDDRQASLSVHLESGGWRCFASCGSGDLVAFHMHRQGVDFRTAVLDLIDKGTWA